jgi:hypothetical protein
LTTINAPSEEIIAPLISNGGVAYVAGDTATPRAEWRQLAKTHPALHFVDDELGNRNLVDLSTEIGSGTYARKNLAFLAALQDGAKEIFELDDDNRYEGTVRNPRTQARKCLQASSYLKYRSNQDLERDGPAVPNIFNTVYRTEQLWFRGFPITQLGSELDLTEVPLSSLSDVDVITFAVAGEPDVDAIARLTSPEYRLHEARFISQDEFRSPNGSYVVAKNSFLPANTQATLWLNMRKSEFLYHPRSVSMRFSDILKMYVCQASCNFAYGGVAVEQIRNPHNFLEDFLNEVEMHKSLSELLKALSEARGASLEEIYGRLFAAGIVSRSECDTAAEFAKLARAFGEA